MKQHITEEQIHELSNKGKEKLFTWCADSNYLKVKAGESFIIPPLSIGQLIEFLDEFTTLHIDKMDESTQSWWRISYDEILDDSHNELCDALWQACKDVLEK